MAQEFGEYIWNSCLKVINVTEWMFELPFSVERIVIGLSASRIEVQVKRSEEKSAKWEKFGNLPPY